MEPIVSRADIRELAWAAARQGVPMHQANPYAQGSAAHLHFEHDYIERALELSEVEA